MEFELTHKLIRFLTEMMAVEYIFCFEENATCIDLMIVLDKQNVKPFDELEQVIAFATVGHSNIHCTLHTYGSMYAKLLQGNLFYSMACNSSTCIYAANNAYLLPAPDPVQYELFKYTVTAQFNAGFKKAEGFYMGAELYLKIGNMVMAAFMLQQACELSYRTLLLAFRNKDMRCHDLVALRRNVRRFTPAIIGVFSKNEVEELSLLSVLQEAYIRARYEADYSIDADLVGFFYQKTGLMQEKVKTVFYKALYAMAPVSNYPEVYLS